MGELAPLDPEERLLVDGTLREATGGGRFENLDPATEERLGSCADATEADMDAAIAAARRAFDETDWSTNPEFRKRCLGQLRDALAEEIETLRTILVLEAGVPVALTQWYQLDPLVGDLAYWRDQIDAFEVERELPVKEVMGRATRRTVRREPFGVVGAITPWNVPLHLIVVKLGPALATGNTVVLKPPPDTPWCGTTFGRLVAERTDIPPGVVNVITSSDHTIGERLVADSRVDLVSFTGSTATGKRIMEVGASNIKKLFLELGGKSAHIVLDDIDPAEAAASFLAGCTHAGQGCSNLTRILVPRARYEEGVEAVVKGVQAVAYGDPRDPKNMMGPVIRKSQHERILGIIEAGKHQARLVCGGGVPKGFDRGYFIEPTVFADVSNESPLAQDEIFGPVLCVIPYEDDDDAVRIANDSRYGLSGAVTGADSERAHAVARRIRTGTMSVNGGQYFAVDAPFGGYRESGLGRENGSMGYEEYLETKLIASPA
ncbi:MAG: aldehyde dehydrogenase family protein [Myxococcota bacterium]|jgi:aldehyde dehydrogenase (NAD+)|nr:aldehyde dehydrogenase family protein [Myxococcota bacterium]